MEAKYHLNDKDEFVIESYNQAKPFASFLPGIAALHGKPLWAFYVNRGQCMASFGQTSKECAIMEFYPANTSYRRVNLEGFRTFVKSDGAVYEPFRLPCCGASGNTQRIYISMHELRLEEVSPSQGLRFEVIYFTVPNENFPALARVLTVENISKDAKKLQVIDGMPKICPFGMNEFFMKHMSRTIEAWMEVACLPELTPFYRLRVDAADTSETKYITSGNFYLSRLSGGAKPSIIADPRIVFGDFCDLTWPGAFASEKFGIPGSQVDRNITPSAFSCCDMELAPGRSARLSSLAGHAGSAEELAAIDLMVSEGFFDSKRAENAQEISSRASSVSVFSGIREFDLYARQTNLDNILRGGLPVSPKSSGKTVYVFNRKHGDLERDYNNFVLSSKFYSQGNGNFRDTNQNRRTSVWLNPSVGEKDIKDFYSLIQLDGYNPLIVKSESFSVKDRSCAKTLAEKYFARKLRLSAELFLQGEFTLPSLAEFVSAGSVKDQDGVIGEVIKAAASNIEAEHGEGFWADHWTYNLDLVKSFLALFPERQHDILFRDRSYTFFDNPHRVKPRSQRIVSGADKKARQYHCVYMDEEKRRLIESRKSERYWVRTKYGKGGVYRCTLAAKMLVIVANKMATLDPSGVGMELEADKPAWCDSMNGLPALMGSSASETIELLRLVRFLKSAFAEAAGVSLSVELAQFIKDLAGVLSRTNLSKDRGKNFWYWDKSNALKERYRARVRFGVSGKETPVDKEDVVEFLSLCSARLEDGIKRGRDPSGVPYTYFINDLRSTSDGKAKHLISSRPLPLFLEAPVHAMKIADGIFDARALYEAVRSSPLYDRALGMYKLNAPLDDQPLEIGRMRAFTPGWLENESIWLHMEYKFLLETLKRGLHEEFFRDLRSALIPFQPPERYGRSILENSSFIACSRFFDEELRGNGFVARLSGATAEFLHMLLIMELGNRPFSLEGDDAVFTPSPVLQSSFFSEGPRDIEFDFCSGSRRVSLPADSYAFSLFQNTLIIYENPKRRDTFGASCVKPVRYKVSYGQDRQNIVDSTVLGEPYAADLRNKSIETISILLD